MKRGSSPIATLVFTLSVTVAGSAAPAPRTVSGEREWKNMQYLGGAPGVRVNRLEPNHTLVITPQKIALKTNPPLAEGQSSTSNTKEAKLLLEIPRHDMLAVTYGSFRHDRPGAPSGFGIRGLWPKVVDHLIIIEYKLAEGGEAEILVRVDKKHYKEITTALTDMLPDTSTTTPPK